MAKPVPSRLTSFFIGYAAFGVLWTGGIPVLAMTPLYTDLGLLILPVVAAGLGVFTAWLVRTPARRVGRQLVHDHPAELLISVVLDPQSVELISELQHKPRASGATHLLAQTREEGLAFLTETQPSQLVGVIPWTLIGNIEAVRDMFVISVGEIDLYMETDVLYGNLIPAMRAQKRTLKLIETIFDRRDHHLSNASL
jgi:hypothetical protein